jgi:hypothetical protein
MLAVGQEEANVAKAIELRRVAARTRYLPRDVRGLHHQLLKLVNLRLDSAFCLPFDRNSGHDIWRCRSRRQTSS